MKQNALHCYDLSLPQFKTKFIFPFTSGCNTSWDSCDCKGRFSVPYSLIHIFNPLANIPNVKTIDAKLVVKQTASPEFQGLTKDTGDLWSQTILKGDGVQPLAAHNACSLKGNFE